MMDSIYIVPLILTFTLQERRDFLLPLPMRGEDDLSLVARRLTRDNSLLVNKSDCSLGPASRWPRLEVDDFFL